MNRLGGNGAAPQAPDQPTTRVNVSLTEDRNAIVVRYFLFSPGHALADCSMVLPIETAAAVARAMLEQADKATSRIVVPQRPIIKGS